MTLIGKGDGSLNIFQLSQLEGVMDKLGYAPGTSIDSLSKSEQEQIIVNLLASNPMLLFSFNSLFANALNNASSVSEFKVALASFDMNQSKIISAMLDAWAESVAVQAEISKEAAKKQNIKNEEIQKDRKSGDIVDAYIKWLDVHKPDTGEADLANAGVFVNYLSYLTQQQHYDTVSTTINMIVDNYFDKGKAGGIADNELNRSLLSTMVLQALIVGPAYQNIVMQPINPADLSTQIRVNAVSDRSVFQPGQFTEQLSGQLLPAINFFVLDLVKTVTIQLFVKQQESNKKPLDKDFANAFADKVLAEISNTDIIKEKLIRLIPGSENATVQQLSDAVVYAQLFGLASSLALFVKVDGGTLQENELAELLKSGKGLSEKELEITGKMNAILQGLPPDKRAVFAEALLKYVASMPDPSGMTDFKHALEAAYAEVSTGTRAVNSPLR